MIDCQASQTKMTPRERLFGDDAQGAYYCMRVTTDLPTACAKLREHHPGSWVGPGLEAVWHVMAAEGSLVVLELWLEGRMVAADFGHPGAARVMRRAARGE